MTDRRPLVAGLVEGTTKVWSLDLGATKEWLMASIRRVVAELRQNKAARTVAAAGVLVGLAAFAIAGWRGVLFAMGAAVFLLGVSDRIRKRVKRWYLLNSV